MNLPKISVITPTLNAGKSIQTALLSVVNQTYQNIEHIIIDNASTDNTLSLIRKHQQSHKNIRLLTEKDKGIYEAINKGLDICTGDWIYFMGADDWLYDENVFKTLYEQGLFQEEQIIYGNVIIKGDAPWAKDNSVYDGAFTLEKLFKWNICHQSIFYPKSIIKQIGYYNTHYKITSDWDYNMRCWAKYKFKYVDAVIANFKTGGKSSLGGDRSLYLDFPDNVIKYFNLDLNDPEIYQVTSPFYYPISRHRENDFLNQIHGFKEEAEKLTQTIEDLSKKHSETIHSLKNDHIRSENSIRMEFDESLNRMRREHEAALTNLMIENGQRTAAIKADHEQMLNELNSKHELSFMALRINHQETINAVRSSYEQIISSCQIEHREAINKLRNDLELIIGSLQAEQKSFWELFRQKENEFMQEIATYKQHTNNLSNSLRENDLLFKGTLENHKSEITSLTRTIHGKDKEISTIRNSFTWKTGRFLLSPIQLLLRLWKKNSPLTNQ